MWHESTKVQYKVYPLNSPDPAPDYTNELTQVDEDHPLYPFLWETNSWDCSSLSGYYIIKIRVRDNDLIKEELIITEVGDPGSQFLAGVGDLGFQLPNDSDGDCIPDYIEDKDNDLSVDPGETNPHDADSDDDGLIDGNCNGSEDLNNNGEIEPGETDPLNPDTDGDSIYDGTERGITEPETEDTNLSAGYFIPDDDPLTITDPTNSDTDADGLTDGEEDVNKNGAVNEGETDPNNPDTDEDGYNDSLEVSLETDPLDPDSTPPDIDVDFIPDELDNCPEDYNPDQTDSDEDGLGDICELDDDSDTIPDVDDNCPSVSNLGQEDVDQDGTGDVCDNCPNVSNSDQSDTTDNDTIGDICDNCQNDYNPEQTDSDGDCIGDVCDPSPDTYDPSQPDTDNDGIGDACDECTDSDGDGYGNPGFPDNTCPDDNCPDTPNPGQEDSDGDGIGDACEAAPIPTLSEWGIIIFITLIMGIGVMILRKRRMA